MTVLHFITDLFSVSKPSILLALCIYRFLHPWIQPTMNEKILEKEITSIMDMYQLILVIIP
jgi:hypothetical protein